MITSIDPVTSSQAQTSRASSSTSAGAGGFAAVLGQALAANVQALQASAQTPGTAAPAALSSNLTPIDASQPSEDGKKQQDAFVLGSLGLQASLAASQGNAGAFTILAFMMNKQIQEMQGSGQSQTTKRQASGTAVQTPAAPKRAVAKAASATVATSASQAAASSASTTSSASASLTDAIVSNAATSQTAAASNAGTSSSAALASNASTNPSASLENNAEASSSATAASDANAAASASVGQTGNDLDTLTDELETLLAELDEADRGLMLKKLKELAASYDSAA